MAFKLDTSKFKKISSDKHVTVMRHADGHELRISHKGLSPAFRKQIMAIPTEDQDKGLSGMPSTTQVLSDGGQIPGGPGSPAIDPKKAKQMQDSSQESGIDAFKRGLNDLLHPSPSPSPSASPKQATYDDGGQVQQPDQSYDAEHPRTPATVGQAMYRLTHNGNDPEPQTMDAGGKVTSKPYLADITPEQVEAGTSDSSGWGDKPKDQRPYPYNLAKGGGVNSDPTQRNLLPGDKLPNAIEKQVVSEAKGKIKKRYDDGGEVQEVDNNPVAPQEAKGEMTQDADDDSSQSQPDQTSQADQAAPAVPAQAATDPSLDRKREIYNSLAPVPNRFGPKGEEPAGGFNPVIWSNAERAYNAEQTQQEQAQQQAAKSAEALNIVRQRAGLPPVSVPTAPSDQDEQPPKSQPSQPSAVPSATPAMASMPSPAQPGQPQAQDPYGTQAYLNAYTRGLGEAKAGVSQEAAAQGALGQAQANQLQQGTDAQTAMRNAYQDHLADLMKERQGFVSDIQNTHVDPANYWKDHSKLMTGIGILLAGFNPTSNPNAAIAFLNHNMEMNLKAQQADLGRKENLLSANMQQFHNLRDATDMTRIMQSDIISNELRKQAAIAQTPMAKARALQLAGQLDMQAAPIMSQIAMRKALMSGLTQSNPDQIGNLITSMHMVNPEMAKTLESRFVPKVGLAQVPIPDKVREEMTARSDLDRQLTNLEQFASTHSGSLSPTERNTGNALARNVQDAYRRANGQGVFREAEKDFVEKSISTDPSVFFNKIRALPGYKATAQQNRATLQNLYKSYGIPVKQIPSTPGFSK